MFKHSLARAKQPPCFHNKGQGPRRTSRPAALQCGAKWQRHTTSLSFVLCTRVRRHQGSFRSSCQSKKREHGRAVCQRGSRGQSAAAAEEAPVCGRRRKDLATRITAVSWCPGGRPHPHGCTGASPDHAHTLRRLQVRVARMSARRRRQTRQAPQRSLREERRHSFCGRTLPSSHPVPKSQDTPTPAYQQYAGTIRCSRKRRGALQRRARAVTVQPYLP